MLKVCIFSQAFSFAFPKFKTQKHIEQIEQTYDERNALALRNACVDAKTSSMRKFSSKISSLMLPILPSALKVATEAARSDILQFFQAKLKDFEDTVPFLEARRELEVFVILLYIYYLYIRRAGLT